jgi:hypothetical protein
LWGGDLLPLGMAGGEAAAEEAVAPPNGFDRLADLLAPEVERPFCVRDEQGRGPGCDTLIIRTSPVATVREHDPNRLLDAGRVQRVGSSRDHRFELVRVLVRVRDMTAKVTCSGLTPTWGCGPAPTSARPLHKRELSGSIPGAPIHRLSRRSRKSLQSRTNRHAH